MAASFPDEIKTFRAIENRTGVVYDADNTKTLFAEDVDGITDEILAIENTLGLNPEGAFTTVSDRIADIEEKPALVLGSLAEISTSGNPSLGQTAFNKLALNVQVYNYGDDLEVDTANNRIKILTAGVYRCTAFVQFTDNVNGNARGLSIQKNGAGFVTGFLSKDAGGRYYNQYTRTIACAVNDYIEAVGYQDSGGNLTYIGWLNVERVR